MKIDTFHIGWWKRRVYGAIPKKVSVSVSVNSNLGVEITLISGLRDQDSEIEGQKLSLTHECGTRLGQNLSKTLS
jgi:hypothetical protein